MISLNFDLVNNILPNYYRRNKPVRTDWLNLITSGTRTGYTNYVAEYDTYNYLAKHNYQTIVMEHCVNNVLPLMVDIYILDGMWLDQPYLFNRIEEFKDQEYIFNRSESGSTGSTPSFGTYRFTGFTQLYIYNRVEYDDDQYDFEVVMSSGDTAYKPSIIKYIDMFKQGGKNYIITEV